jgi:hypothetical protein
MSLRGRPNKVGHTEASGCDALHRWRTCTQSRAARRKRLPERKKVRAQSLPGPLRMVAQALEKIVRTAVRGTEL